MACCPFLDITCCIVALLLSIVAYFLRGSDRSLEGSTCCRGFRNNLNGSLEGLLTLLDWSEWLLIPFNVLAALAILLSNFECDSQNSRAMTSLLHSFTSSRTLCMFQGIAMTSVLLQLFSSEFLVAWTGVFYLLNHMCIHHQDLLPQAEQLIRSVAGEHGESASTWASMFSPLSAQQFEGNLNLQEYCTMGTQDPSLDVVLQQVWLAALSTTVSQFLMAVALSGERQRAGVHEDHSLHGAYTAVSDQFGGLRENVSQGASSLGQSMQNLASGVRQNAPDLPDIQPMASQMLARFKGRQGH